MKFKYIFLSVLFIAVTSCETDIENPDAQPNYANKTFGT